MGVKQPKPEITYSEACSRYVAYRDEQGKIAVCRVSSVPGFIFRKLALAACKTARNPEIALSELSSFTERDYESSMLNAWYAMDALLRFKAAPFWAGSAEEAKKHLV